MTRCSLKLIPIQMNGMSPDLAQSNLVEAQTNEALPKEKALSALRWALGGVSPFEHKFKFNGFHSRRHLYIKCRTKPLEAQGFCTFSWYLLDLHITSTFIHNNSNRFFHIWHYEKPTHICEWTLTVPISSATLAKCEGCTNVVAIVTTYYFRMSHLRRIFLVCS